MGMFDLFKKKHTEKEMHKPQHVVNISADEYLDDRTFIEDIKHFQNGAWHQYDCLLAVSGYDWNTMIEWADSIAESDLKHISQVTTGSLGEQEYDIIESYNKNNGKCAKTPELKNEMGVLSLAGISQTLKLPMKIVWFNQTRILRFFTLVDDDILIRKYIETIIRRSFDTENAMK